MKVDHVVWLHRIERHACGLLPLEGFDNTYMLKKGIALAERWPNGAVMAMNPDNPHDMLLVDSLFNVSSLLVLSERVKTFLSEQVHDELEFLPVDIRDHRDKMVEERYFVLNLPSHLDLLDPVASDAEASLVPGKYSCTANGIVLRDTPDDMPSPKLFRLQGFGIPTLVSRELAAAIDEEGFSGVEWGELADFRDQTW